MKLDHSSIVDLVTLYLQKHHPQDYIKKYFVYPEGEIDIMQVHDKKEWNAYEIKSRNTSIMQGRAYEQLMRFQKFVLKTLPGQTVRTYFVRPIGSRVTITELTYSELEKLLR